MIWEGGGGPDSAYQSELIRAYLAGYWRAVEDFAAHVGDRHGEQLPAGGPARGRAGWWRRRRLRRA